MIEMTIAVAIGMSVTGLWMVFKKIRHTRTHGFNGELEAERKAAKKEKGYWTPKKRPSKKKRR